MNTFKTDNQNNRQVKNSENKWRSLRLAISVSSALVALAAVFVSVWTGYENRRYYELSSSPYLNITKYQGTAGKPGGVNIVNLGVGPAILDSLFIRWEVNGSTEIFNGFSYDEMQRLDDKILEVTGFEIGKASHEDGMYIPAGGKIDIIQSINLQEEKKAEFLDLMKKLEINVWYESVYGKPDKKTD